MPEFIRVAPEQQFYENNLRLVTAVQSRLPESDIQPTGHNAIATVENETPDGTRLIFKRIGFFMIGDDIEQPVQLEVLHPDVQGSRSMEVYSFSRENRRGAVRWSCLSSEYLLKDENEERTLLPTLGYVAQEKLELVQIFGSKSQRLRRKERKVALEMLKISMDDHRTKRLLGLIELAQ